MPDYNPYSLAGKTILITGASSGIGQATAVECSKLGARVVITARNAERLQETFDMLEGEGHIQVLADIADTAAVQAMVDELPEIQGCVLNAGIGVSVLTPFIKEDDLQNVLKVNTIGPIMTLQRLLKKKKLRKGGSVVFTSSVAANYVFSKGNVVYSTSKGAINAFMKNAAVDLAPKGIRCNSVNPGMVDTKLIHGGGASDEDLANNAKIYPLGRYGQPIDIAHAIIYLLSDASSWVTGLPLVIDGGINLI